MKAKLLGEKYNLIDEYGIVLSGNKGKKEYKKIRKICKRCKELFKTSKGNHCWDCSQKNKADYQRERQKRLRRVNKIS